MICFFKIDPCSPLFLRSKQEQQKLADILNNSEDSGRRRSSRKREDKSYVECPDIVIEEDYLSKPSPAKKANLGSSPAEEAGRRVRRVPGEEKKGVAELLAGGNGGQTNGIEMESEDEGDGTEEIFPPIPAPQVGLIAYLF